MSGPSFRFAMVRSWRTALILCGVVAAFVWMSLAVSAAVLTDFAGLPFLAEPPKAMAAFLGGAGSFVTPDGWLASTFMHPIVLSMSAVGAFLVASSTGAQELESGTIDLVLSRPVSRSQHLKARLAAALILSTVVQMGTLIGALAALATVPEVRALSFSSVLVTTLVAVALYAMFACAGMWIFAANSLRGRALWTAIGLVTASYLLNFIALAFNATSFLGPITPFRYFRPGTILAGEGILFSLAVLVLVAIICAIGALRSFGRRDLAR